VTLSRGITFPQQGLTYQMLGNTLVDQSNPIDPALGFIDRAIFTVVDDDFPPGTLGFEANAYAITENQATAQIAIVRLGGSFGPVTIRARTVATAELGTTTRLSTPTTPARPTPLPLPPVRPTSRSRFRWWMTRASMAPRIW